MRFLRYHDRKNWPQLRYALKAMGNADMNGNGKRLLIAAYQPMAGACPSNSKEKFLSIPSMVMEKNQPKPGQILTQHTSLPPPRELQAKSRAIDRRVSASSYCS